MKKILPLTLMALITLAMLTMSACADKRLILVPQSEYYPTFPTQDFKKSKKVKLDMYVEQEDVNGTTITYLVTRKEDMMSFIKDTKELRSNYNVLLRKINEFNLKIKEQNRIQNEKKPTEIESIDDSWYK